MSGGARQSLPPADILVTHAFWAPLLLPKREVWGSYVHVGRYPKGQMETIPAGPARVADAKPSGCEGSLCGTIGWRLARPDRFPYPLPFHVKDEPTPFNERPKRVLYAGRIHPEKGLLELVRAWAKLPESIQMEWTLRLIGPWREEQGGGGLAYKEEVRKSGGENVEIFEPVFEEEDLINPVPTGTQSLHIPP